MWAQSNDGDWTMIAAVVIIFVILSVALGIEKLLDWYGEKHKDEID